MLASRRQQAVCWGYAARQIKGGCKVLMVVGYASNSLRLAEGLETK